jgi:hypothetical protein
MLVSRGAEKISLQDEKKRKRRRARTSRVSILVWSKRSKLSNQSAEALVIDQKTFNIPLVVGRVSFAWKIVGLELAFDG